MQNDPKNPWSAAGWSITAQGLYVRQYGLERAKARARDAGTILGGPRPLPPEDSIEQSKRGPLAPPAVVRPGDRAIYMVDKNKPFIPMRRSRAVQIPALRAGLGLEQTTVLSFEQYLEVTHDLGLTQDVALTLLSPDGQISATMSLGIEQDTTLSFEVNIAAAADLGIDMSALVDVTVTATSSQALGITQTVALQLERDLAAAMELGITVAASVDTTAANRIATDGTTRVTTDGTIRVISL